MRRLHQRPTLCFQCHRPERDRLLARQLDLLPRPSVARAELTDRQVAHRRRMLAHLERCTSA